MKYINNYNYYFLPYIHLLFNYINKNKIVFTLYSSQIKYNNSKNTIVYLLLTK